MLNTSLPVHLFKSGLVGPVPEVGDVEVNRVLANKLAALGIVANGAAEVDADSRRFALRHVAGLI